MNEQLPKLEFERKRTIAKHCPCGKSNRDGKFAPYIGLENCGFCHSCGETFLPSIDKTEFPINRTPLPKIEKPISYISIDILKASLKNYDENNFISFLNSTFGKQETEKLISKYYLATSKHWSGAIVFWQIDQSNKIRTGKIMQYNATNGKRIKEPYNHVTWVHSVIKSNDFNVKQCFFGEHLLIDKSKPVAIVESEKTAVISSVYFPKFIWLAVGSKTNLSHERMKVLKGRNIVLFPDLNCFDLWQSKADEFTNIGSIEVSQLLENIATDKERKQGLDLADYLLNLDNRKITEPIKENLSKIPKGKLFYWYELKEKFNLNDSTINKHFVECFGGALWIPN